MTQASLEFSLNTTDNRQLANLCGQHHEHIQQIEDRLDVKIKQRADHFKITGDSSAIQHAKNVIEALYEKAKKGDLSPAAVHEQIAQMHPDKMHPGKMDPGKMSLADKSIPLKNTHGTINARSENQALYLEAIAKHDITFGIGPAGTGKTYLAVACAVEALKHERVDRILLVRPAVEAGEQLGFLPGDLEQKIDPYLRPLYDALYEMLGSERVNKLIERKVIELAPLAYMRGRTLNNAFIIMDESQNTTVEQMKMFLTRIGFGSKVVITGDATQVDLPDKKPSGLHHVMKVLNNIKGLSFIHFNAKDVVRHPLVQSIIEAYEKHDSNQK